MYIMYKLLDDMQALEFTHASYSTFSRYNMIDSQHNTLDYRMTNSVYTNGAGKFSMEKDSIRTLCSRLCLLLIQ